MRHCHNVVAKDGRANALSVQVVSTLSVLEPFRRAVVGVPFLYQKVNCAMRMNVGALEDSN